MNNLDYKASIFDGCLPLFLLYVVILHVCFHWPRLPDLNTYNVYK